MGLVQPEVRGDAYNAHFLRCKAAITLEQSVTKQTSYIRGIAVKIRKFGRPGSGQLGRDVICEGCSVCAMLYRVAIDALQTRIISRCNETYHLTTRPRRSVHRFNDFISRRREVPESFQVRHFVTTTNSGSFFSPEEARQPRKKLWQLALVAALQRHFQKLRNNRPSRSHAQPTGDGKANSYIAHT
jgi:hypothetical protein